MNDSHKLNDTQPDSMAESSAQSLAPGFRFHPTDEELVLYYLKRKVLNKPLRFDPIAIIDIYKLEPWDLPGQSRLKSRDLEWYFFSALETKYGNGWRTNRATEQGYWKTTGKDRNVRHGERVVGMKKTLVFHIGRAPKGERTNWVMHEYRLVDEELEKSGLKQAAFVLCRVFEKSGTGPKNGEQYGAPFIEEEWETDELTELKQEVSENQQDFQHQNVNEQDLALAVTTSNILPASSDGGDSPNHVEEPKDFSEDGQKVFIGNGEHARMPDDEQTSIKQEQFQMAEQFQMSEEFLMDEAPVDNEFFEVEYLLNVANGCSDEVADEATSRDAPVFNGKFGELNPVEPDRAGFDMLDEYLNYFDATDNDYFIEFDSLAIPEVADPNFNQSAFTEGNNDNGQTSVDLPGPSNTHVGEGSSLAEKSEIAKVADDVQYSKDWDSSFAKQVSRMLGSIPAPNAFAAEMPTKEASFGQNSATSSSVNVTAGMIHISGTVSGSGDVWSLGKTRDAAFMLPFNMTLHTEMSMEPMSNIVSNKVMGNMMRSGYYFILFWVVILSELDQNVGMVSELLLVSMEGGGMGKEKLGEEDKRRVGVIRANAMGYTRFNIGKSATLTLYRGIRPVCIKHLG